MLLQSHLRDENGNFYQDLLPALPSKLANGKISGLKGRGGFELDITWENGELLAVKVKSLLGNPLNLRYNNKTISKETTASETYLFGPNDFL
jgi:alpha-L-fucosidase 2